MQKFIGGIGCFWDETKYEGIAGITSTECGYCGGKSPNVSYKEVCGGNTEHVEVVKVEFNPPINFKILSAVPSIYCFSCLSNNK